MRLSAFSVVDAFPDGPAYSSRDRFAEVGALAETADRAGLAAFWVAEHHFHSGGLCPSPPVLLASLGARTRRLRLGAMVAVLPFHNPIEVAEQYALLDRLLGGRLNLGLGSGYIPIEFEGFGIDPSTKRERFDRSFELVRRALRGEPLNEAAGTASPIRLNVAPIQHPGPPVWIAVQRREAIPFVARKGASLALIPYATTPGLPELAQQIREFRSAVPEGSSPSVSVALHLYAGDRVEGARRALQRYLDSRRATQSAFYLQRVAEDPRLADAGTIEASGFALLGSPESVAKRLGAFAELGVDEVLGIFDFGGLSPAEVHHSVERLAGQFR